MENLGESLHEKATLDNYTLLKTLGSGVSAKVKLAKDQQGNYFALKIFNLSNPQNNETAMQLVKSEVEATLDFNYGHISKYYAFKQDAIM